MSSQSVSQALRGLGSDKCHLVWFWRKRDSLFCCLDMHKWLNDWSEGKQSQHIFRCIIYLIWIKHLHVLCYISFNNSLHAPNTHHRYVEGSHCACNTYCRGGCGFPYDSMHIGEFVTAVSPILIPVHQVKWCPDGQRDTGAGVKDPVTQSHSWQQLWAVVDLVNGKHHSVRILKLSWVQSEQKKILKRKKNNNKAIITYGCTGISS